LDSPITVRVEETDGYSEVLRKQSWVHGLYGSI